MEFLIEKLQKLAESDVYPFHMPGHKRQIDLKVNPYAYDITEIDGFDNLHHAEGVLKDLEKRFAALYQGEEAYLLVNGSSGGILSAIRAAAKPGEEILIARNSHKSVYHGVLLNRLKVHYLYPKELEFGINGSIAPEDVKEAFRKHPGIRTVVITSPTYDGITSDVKKIAKIVHENGATFIVDAAHGAHFGLFDEFLPNDAVRFADISILSLHKTLPSPTQSAVLILNSQRVTREKMAFNLNVFETSSPSYLMMAAMEYALSFCEKTKENCERVKEYRKNLEEFYEEAKKLRCLNVFPKEGTGYYGKDITKLLISTKHAEGMDGEALMKRLREEYHIECEMAAAQYVTALSTFFDTKEGLQRLSLALQEIDQTLTYSEKVKLLGKDLYELPEKVTELYEAEESMTERIPVLSAAGRVSAEFAYLYPPGIPVLTPGERIPEKFAGNLLLMRDAKMQMEGLSDYSGETIKVLR